ncbi:MAG: hypothetical protein K2F69_01960 [Bacteroidaceae bacterium]|nr:hypothetical protein [Bacteroidaceae bacterium]
MELLSGYYSYLEVNGKDVGTIFRELTTNETYKQIADGTWKEAFINLFGTMLTEMPDVRSIVNRILHEGLLKQGLDIDPENVYVNTFGSSVVVDGKGVFHKEDSLISSYRLTDAALMNFFTSNYYDDWDVLDYYTQIGIYNVGKGGRFEASEPLFGNGWGPSSQVCVAKKPADILYNSDIQAAYVADYKKFWSKYNTMYRDMLADLFLASAIMQYKAKLLSEYGFAMIRKVYAGQDGVKTYRFNIDQYDSTDIIVMVATISGAPHVVLYIPGASTPFVEFDHFTQMRKWLVQRLANPEDKKAFLKHFSIYVRQDGTTYSGVDTFVDKMVNNVPGWNPQDYIMLKPAVLPYGQVFDSIRDKTKAVMLDDANREITSNSEVYRDYVLNFFETLLSHLMVIDMIVPEIGIPLDVALSTTALGLSADIVVNGDTLEKRLDGVGSLVSSTIYTAINLIPIFVGIGVTYKGFRRPAAQIPAYADEASYMQHRFGLASIEELNGIQPGQKPYVLHLPDNSKLVLARLANEGKPLTVLRHVSGNKYVRLNPITLEELEGEGLISELLTDRPGRRVFVSNSRLLGGAPYNPFESMFEEVWPEEIFARKADKLGTLDSKYVTIKEKLRQMHALSDFESKQSLAHELYFLLKDYEKTFRLSLRKKIISELKMQVRRALYDDEVEFLGDMLLGESEKINPAVAGKIYMVSIAERMGELTPGTTESLIKFVLHDPTLSVYELSTSFQGKIPSDLPFSVKYVIDDLAALNNIKNQYYKLEAYTGLGLKNNKEAFLHSLKEAQRVGMLSKWKLSSDENMVYIGNSYEELVRTITVYSCDQNTRYGLHPLNVLDMIMDLLPLFNTHEMMATFGTGEYYTFLAAKRIREMKDVFDLSSESLFVKFDKDVASVFDPAFNQLADVQDRLEMLMNKTKGIILSNEYHNIEYLNQHLDFFQSKGVTHLGVTDFFADLEQTELDEFMRDGTLTTNLGATILSVDRGRADGAFRQLIMSAQQKGIKIVALGESDADIAHESSVYTKIYVKGRVNRNADRLLGGNKFVILAHPELINTTPGIREGMPGLAQQMSAPGLAFNLAETPGVTFNPSVRSVNFLPDAVQNRRAMGYARLPRWVSIAPAEGRFMGWKKYGDGFTFVTPAQREAAVFSRIEDDLEGFKEKFRYIREKAVPYQSAQVGTCDRVTSRLQGIFSKEGIPVGPGRSLSWWIKDGDDYVNNVHTAGSVFIRDREYIVDATHLQFPHDSIDEGVMILPPNEWAEEILNRVKGSNPYMVNRSLFGNSLWALRSPRFTKPHVRRIPE